MLNKMFDQFNAMYGLGVCEVNADELHKAYRLIDDEVMELNQELMCRDPHNAVKEMADIAYIALERMRYMGVDLDSVMTELHRSNMSKTVHPKRTREELKKAQVRYPNSHWVSPVGIFGNVLKCKDTGKVIKPTTYSPAIITDEMIGR